MKAKIKIAPHKAGEKGTLCFPMKRNILAPKDGTWRLVKCPVCGEECWETPIARKAMAEDPQLRHSCTLCALKGINVGGRP